MIKLDIISLHVYPLTGAQGVQVDRAGYGPAGFSGDREFLLYDPAKLTRISSKQAPALLALSCEIDQMLSSVDISFPNDSLATLPSGYGQTPVSIRVFGQSVPCYDMGGNLAQQFSDYLDKPVRVARKSDQWLDGGITAPAERKEAPLHVVTIPTVEWIRETVAPETSVASWRPNIVVDGDFPSEAEQEWVGDTLVIGDHWMVLNRSTPRCPVPGLHPQTGEVLYKREQLYDQVAKNEGGRASLMGVYALPGDDVHHFVEVTDQACLLQTDASGMVV